MRIEIADNQEEGVICFFNKLNSFVSVCGRETFLTGFIRISVPVWRYMFRISTKIFTVNKMIIIKIPVKYRFIYI